MQLFSYIGVFLILIFHSNKHPIKLPKYLVFYLLFICYVFYTDLYRLNRTFKVDFLFSNVLIGAFNYMFIIENIHISKKKYAFIIKYSKYILFVAILVIVIQQIYDPNFFVRSQSRFENLLSIGETENRLASIYSWIGGLISVGFCFVPIYLLIVEDLEKKNKDTMVLIIAGLLFAFLSKARWIMVNTLMVFFLLFLNHKGRVTRLFKLLFILPLIFFMSFLFFKSLGVDVEGIVNDRVLNKKEGGITKGSAGSRILAIEAFDKLYWENPFFGVGSIRYGMGGTGKQDYKLRSILKGRSSQIHVGYASLLYTYGLVGALFFLSFLFLLLKKLYLNAKITGYWAPLLGFLGFALANMTLVAYSVFEMGFIIALVVDKYYSQSFIQKSKSIA